MNTNSRIMRLLSTLLLGVTLVGCAYKGAPTHEEVEAKGKEFTTLSRSKAVEVVAEPYVGAKAVPIRAGAQSAPELATHVTLRMRGTLPRIAAGISDLTPLTVQVGADPAPLTPAKTPTPGAPADLPDLLDVPSGGLGTVLNVSYEGTLRGLLDHVSVASGYGWEYDAKAKTVVFTRLTVKTFTLLSAPGKQEFQGQITNKSKETSNSSIGGGGVNQTVSTADTSSQTMQSNKTRYAFDVWEDTEKAVKALLSPEGSVVGNQATGTLTVRDRFENVRQISSYIADINQRLSRQVALTVNVWALEVSDDAEAGIDLQAIFANGDVSVVAGSLSSLGGPSTASATIVSGDLKNSTGVLKALKEGVGERHAGHVRGWSRAVQPARAHPVHQAHRLSGGLLVHAVGVRTDLGDHARRSDDGLCHDHHPAHPGSQACAAPVQHQHVQPG